MNCRIEKNFQSDLSKTVRLDSVEPGNIVELVWSGKRYICLGLPAGHTGWTQRYQLMGLDSSDIGFISWSDGSAAVKILNDTITITFGAI